MKVTPFQLRMLPQFLDEGIQQSQLDSVAKKYGEDPSELLRQIGVIDPTADPEDVMKTSKYGPWLLSQLKKATAELNNARWIVNNPEKAVEKGLLPPEDVERAARSMPVMRKQGRAEENMWTTYEDSSRKRLRKVLQSLERIKELGQAERLGIDPDINSYETIPDLRNKLHGIDPEAIVTKRQQKRGSVDPLLVPGSELFHQEEGILVFKVTEADAAQFHGKDTSWCFRGPKYANTYTQWGPLYIFYVNDQWREYHGYINEQSDLDWIVQSPVMPDWYRVAALSLTSGENQVEFQDAGGDHMTDLLSERFGFDPVLRKAYEDVVEMGYEDAGQGIDEYLPDIEPAESIPYYAREVIDEFQLEVDNDGDVMIPYYNGIPRDIANALFMRNNHGATVQDTRFYINARDATSDAWEAVRDHIMGESLDEQTEMEIEFEKEMEAWNDQYAEQFQDELSDALWEKAVEETAERLNIDDEAIEDLPVDKVTLRGIPWPQWSQKIELADEWNYLASELSSDAGIYWEWMDEDASIDTEALVEEATKDLKWLQNHFELKSPWDPAPGQAKMEFPLTQEQHSFLTQELYRRIEGDTYDSQAEADDVISSVWRNLYELSQHSARAQEMDLQQHQIEEFMQKYVTKSERPDGKVLISVKGYETPKVVRESVRWPRHRRKREDPTQAKLGFPLPADEQAKLHNEFASEAQRWNFVAQGYDSELDARYAVAALIQEIRQRWPKAHRLDVSAFTDKVKVRPGIEGKPAGVVRGPSWMSTPRRGTEDPDLWYIQLPEQVSESARRTMRRILMGAR